MERAAVRFHNDHERGSTYENITRIEFWWLLTHVPSLVLNEHDGERGRDSPIGAPPSAYLVPAAALLGAYRSACAHLGDPV